MKKCESTTGNEITTLPTNRSKVITRTLLATFSVPIVCALPELMTIKKQLQLSGQNGLILAKQHTSLITFLSGVSMGWISGGIKSISYANKDFICNKISGLRSAEQQNNDHYDVMNRIYASFLVGGLDALTTHVPSTRRALLWTNQHAITALSNMPFGTGLKNIYKIGFNTRLLKSQMNAGCYVAIVPWLAERSKATFPEIIAQPAAVLCGGIISGFVCTTTDVIGTHICREALFTKNQVKAPSFTNMRRALYKQNGLRVFTAGASWNALVSALAFGTFASVEYFVESDFFAKTYCFFRYMSDNVSISPKPSIENQAKISNCFFQYKSDKELNVPMSTKPGVENPEKSFKSKFLPNNPRS